VRRGCHSSTLARIKKELSLIWFRHDSEMALTKRHIFGRSHVSSSGFANRWKAFTEKASGAFLGCMLWIFCETLVASAAFAQTASALPILSASEIVATMESRNAIRTSHLRTFSGIREYAAEYHSLFGRRRATMRVRVTFAEGRKQFAILSQEGSEVIRNRVFRKLIEAEEETNSTEGRREAALIPENYEFQLLGVDEANGRHAYVLAVKPRQKKKFLVEGKIWVDAADFAVVRVEGRPAKNPSFWLTGTSIEHQYQKIGEFWLPDRNQSRSTVRLGGAATLRIEYMEYDLHGNKPEDITPAATP
jgi:hypothetical protein